MICTSVVPCLSTGLAKNDKIMSMFVLFSRLFGHFASLAFFSKMGRQTFTPKQSNMIFWSNFERYNNKVAIFQKSPAILTEK